MALLAYAQQRLRSFLAELERAFDSDFPYPDSRNALQLLKLQFESKLRQLEDFRPESDPDVVTQQCQITLRDLFIYLPFIGFIVRSTELRNPFEAFGPFLRLAIDILEPGTSIARRKTKLVLSSEWDYSPHMYDRIQNLENFLFIGLPAPESGNPLLLPLAGHELGHAVWHHDDLRTSFQEQARVAIIDAIQASWEQYLRIFGLNIQPQDITTDLKAVESWRVPLNLTLSQAEETFCDFMGLAIFGESYFHAFGYLLAPGLGSRSSRYPESAARVAHLVEVAPTFGVTPPAHLKNLFEKEVFAAASPADRFVLDVADAALKKMISALADTASKVVARSSAVRRSPSESQRILTRFKRVTPAENCVSIADILNAAWLAYEDASLWSQYPTIQGRKSEVLKELVLKNLEILEIERIQNE